MDRQVIYNSILDVLNLENEEVSENTALDSFDFDSIAKLGIISVMDAYANKIISAEELANCVKIGDLVNLAFAE